MPSMVVQIEQTLPGSAPGLLAPISPGGLSASLCDPLWTAKRLAAVWALVMVLLLAAWRCNGRIAAGRRRYGGRWSPIPPCRTCRTGHAE